MVLDAFSITELADLAGVTPRTVRYYLAQGLLPGAGRAGPATRYSEAHLARLRLIRRLQAEHLPLADIRSRLSSLSDDEVADLLEASGRQVQATAAASAVDYVRSVLQSGHQPAASIPAPSSASAPAPMLLAGAGPGSESERTPERSQWERIVLVPDIELHVRRPLTRLQNRRLERVIRIVRRFLEEESPS